MDWVGLAFTIYDSNYDRGLAVDTDKGLLLKLSYIHGIALRTVFRGRRRLTKNEVLAEYGGSGACVYVNGEGRMVRVYIYIYRDCKLTPTPRICMQATSPPRTATAT